MPGIVDEIAATPCPGGLPCREDTSRQLAQHDLQDWQVTDRGLGNTVVYGRSRVTLSSGQNYRLHLLPQRANRVIQNEPERTRPSSRDGCQ